MIIIVKVYRKMKLLLRSILKDNRVIKICFIALTSYLLFTEMVVFLVSKPTLTSVTQRNMKPEDFPVFLICPKQGFDLQSLHKLGYPYSTFYGRGIINSTKNQISWVGNQTKLNVTEVIKQVSTIKTLKDCPIVEAKLNRNGTRYIKLHVELTRAMYPNGRCCRVIKPREAHKHRIFKVKHHNYLGLKKGKLQNSDPTTLESSSVHSPNRPTLSHPSRLK